MEAYENARKWLEVDVSCQDHSTNVRWTFRYSQTVLAQQLKVSRLIYLKR